MLDGIAVLQEQLAAQVGVECAQGVDEVGAAYIARGLPHGWVADEERHDLPVEGGCGAERGVVPQA
jgi:hypothetical protein